MIAYVRERRGFQRIFFTAEDGIRCVVIPRSLNKDPITAMVMNLSEGGAGLAVSRDERQTISVGEQCIIHKLKGIDGLDFMTKMEMEIKWVLDDTALDHIAFGCEFLHIPQDIEEKIRSFISVWNMKYGVEM